MNCSNCREPVLGFHVFVNDVGEYLCKKCYESAVFDTRKKYKIVVDNVNHPSHYTSGKIEVIDFIEDQQLDFRLANVVKYVCRYKYKNGIEDLKKAQWYLNRFVSKYEQEMEINANKIEEESLEYTIAKQDLPDGIDDLFDDTSRCLS